MSGQSMPEVPGTGASVEVAVLDAKDVDLGGGSGLKAQDIVLSDELPSVTQFESSDETQPDAKAGTLEEETSGGEGPVHVFWRFSMGTNITVLLFLMLVQVLHHYVAISMEHSDFTFKIHLRGVPWLPDFFVMSLSAGIVAAFNIQGEDRPWKSFTAIVVVFCTGSVGCFAIPGMGLILAGAIMSGVLCVLQGSQDYVLLRRMGRSSSEIKQFAKYMMLMYLTAYMSTNLGAAALILFGLFGDQLPGTAAVMLTLWLAATERICILTAMRGAKRAPEFAPPRLLSYILVFASAEIEGFRLACVVAGVLKNPNSMGYVTVLLSGVVVNMAFRSGWSSFALTRLTGRSTFIANIPAFVLRDVKLVSGYGRLAFPVGLMVARLFYGTQLPWYFNETLPIVLALATILMVLEDIAILAMEKMNWLAPQGDVEKRHYTSLPDASLSKAYTWRGDQAVPNFSMRSPPKVAEFAMQSFVQVAASTMTFWGVAPLVSMKYLYDLDIVVTPTAIDGAFLWLSN